MKTPGLWARTGDPDTASLVWFLLGINSLLSNSITIESSVFLVGEVPFAMRLWLFLRLLLRGYVFSPGILLLLKAGVNE